MEKVNYSNYLGITDDVMFQNVMKYPENCKMLLHEILPDINIQTLDVRTQERVKTDKKFKSIVMDIRAKDDQDRIYDIEMQVGRQKYLDLRARYYLSKADTTSLHSGEGYQNLKNVYVIFLCPFDPKGYDYKEYDFTYTCKQVGNLALDTKTEIIYINSKGTKGKIRPDLQNFLNLMNNEKPADTKFMRQITTTMDNYRKTPEWRQHEMNTEELIKMAREDGVKDTKLEGLKKNINSLRINHLSNEQIFNTLKQFYSTDYSDEELKHLIVTTK